MQSEARYSFCAVYMNKKSFFAFTSYVVHSCNLHKYAGKKQKKYLRKKPKIAEKKICKIF